MILNSKTDHVTKRVVKFDQNYSNWHTEMIQLSKK
jgi:hypothetical protein